MKTYVDYIEQSNCIGLGQLFIYNELTNSSNKVEKLKELDGYIFTFLADVDYHTLLNENFSDFSTYFEIELIDKDVIKADTKRLYNIYKLNSK